MKKIKNEAFSKPDSMPIKFDIFLNVLSNCSLAMQCTKEAEELLAAGKKVNKYIANGGETAPEKYTNNKRKSSSHI